MAVTLASDYVKGAPDGRDADTAVITVQAGSEPTLFTSHFLGWDFEKACGFKDPYETRLAAVKQIAASSELHTRRNSLSSVEGSVVAMARRQSIQQEEEEKSAGPVVEAGSTTYTLAQLVSGDAPNIDASSKEMYLSDAEFATVFKVDKAAFEKLPKWKRVQVSDGVGGSALAANMLYT